MQAIDITLLLAIVVVVLIALIAAQIYTIMRLRHIDNQELGDRRGIEELRAEIKQLAADIEEVRCGLVAVRQLRPQEMLEKFHKGPRHE